MSYVLIGFSVQSGSMTKDGQNITWDNRVVRFITDVGESQTDIGFSPFEQKFKVDELSSILHVQPNMVNDVLKSMVNKSVTLSFAPVSGELKVRSFGLANKNSN